MTKDESISVLGEPLIACGDNPITGFFRDGHCNTCEEDHGSHTVCIETNKIFLDYSKEMGNDLSTPVLEYGFEGLKQGDTWCLCAARWLEAYNDGAAPRIYLSRTHQRALEIISLDLLKKFAVDLN